MDAAARVLRAERAETSGQCDETLSSFAETRVRLRKKHCGDTEGHHSEQHTLQNNLRSTMKAAGANDCAFNQVHERTRLTTSLSGIRPESRRDLPVEMAAQKKTVAQSS